MNRAIKIVKSVIITIVFTIAIFLTVFTVVSSFVFNNNSRSVFGFRFYTVLSDSMSKTDFDAGDVVIVKQVNPESLKEGDIISYTSQNSHNFGETVTHKIRSLTVNQEGEKGFITYGTTTNTDDEAVVTHPSVLGKYCGKIRKAGYFFEFLKTTQGYIVCIFVPFFVLIVIQGLDCIRIFKRYKAEEQEKLFREREDIENQRLENKRMLDELNELRQHLYQKKESETNEIN